MKQKLLALCVALGMLTAQLPAFALATEAEPTEEPTTLTAEEEPTEEPTDSEIEEDPSEEPDDSETEEEPSEEPDDSEPEEDPSEEPDDSEPEEDPSEEPDESEPEEDPSEEPDDSEPEEDPSDEPDESEPEEDPSEEPDDSEPEEDPSEEPTNLTPGYQTVADENSPSGYTITFTYDPSDFEYADKIISVQVNGPFLYLDPDADSVSDGELDGSTVVWYYPWEYVNGYYPSNWATPDGDFDSLNYGGAITLSIDMELDEASGYYTVSFPITSGGYPYSYVITYEDETAEEGTSSETIADPANPSPVALNAANSDYITSDLTHSMAYGRYDAVKQSESLNLDYVMPTTGTAGTVTYLEYTGAVSDHQDMGVYLPPNYDPNREEGYPVLYISHGGGGNETDWFALANINNIFDNLINNGELEPTIVVTMDNTTLEWDQTVIQDNVLNYLIPYMEANYNVSTKRGDRAFAGLSMGSLTTFSMYYEHPEAFGYFGAFSAVSLPDDDYERQLYDDEMPTLYFTCGTQDFAQISSLEEYLADKDWDNMIDGGRVYGGHDWFTWAISVHALATEILWTQDVPEVNVVTGTYSYHIQGDDWGAGVDKVVLSLDKAVSDVDASDFLVTETKETTDWSQYPEDATVESTTERTILSAYPCDEDGNEVEGESCYVALELQIDPNTGSPIIFHATMYNTWCDPYYLTITLAEESDLTADGATVTRLSVDTTATEITSSADVFEKDVYTATDGTVYNYATYTPEQDTKTLVVWLHGMGEGAVATYGDRTDADIPLLGAEVTALAGEEFQSIMSGAYVLAPQCPTVWMDGGSGGIEGKTTSIYTESLHELIAAYKAEIGAEKVIIAGCSNGGYMTMVLALNYGDEYDAYVPICEAYADAQITDEQIEALAELRMFFIYSQDDTTVTPSEYEIPTLERLKAAGAENLCIFAPEHVYDTTGRFGEDYTYMGHWSWVYFFNNTAVCDDCGIDVWTWMAQQVAETPEPEPAPDPTPGSDTNPTVKPSTKNDTGNKKTNNPNTADTAEVGGWALLAVAAAGAAAAVTLRRKHS